MSFMYTPSALAKGVLGTLLRALTGIDRSTLLGSIAMKVGSDKNNEIYSWLGEAPRMRQLTGDEQLIYDSVSDVTYTLSNEIWKAGIAIKRRDFDDDQVGGIQKRISQLAQVSAGHVNRLIVTALTANGTCYDGVTFFSDAHPARGQQTATQDNSLASSGVTVANIQADVMLAIQAMVGFLAENSEPFDDSMGSITILTAPQLLGAMTDAVFGQLISNTSNVRFGGMGINIIPSARITTATQFFVCNSGNPEDLPIIIQERDPLEVRAQLDGDAAFDNETYKFQTRWRGASGYGHWQRAVRVQ